VKTEVFMTRPRRVLRPVKASRDESSALMLKSLSGLHVEIEESEVE
jgi:hypothetical protein